MAVIPGYDRAGDPALASMVADAKCIDLSFRRFETDEPATVVIDIRGQVPRQELVISLELIAALEGWD